MSVCVCLCLCLNTKTDVNALYLDVLSAGDVKVRWNSLPYFSVELLQIGESLQGLGDKWARLHVNWEKNEK